jgi:micrococcal nuclease
MTRGAIITFLGFFTLGIAIFSPYLALAGDLAGPVRADILRVIDGDTFVAEAEIWPGQFIRTAVRIRGVDAPEMKSRCAAEKARAISARAALETMLAGEPVYLRRIEGDKYFGRVVADVTTSTGFDVAPALTGNAHARPYDGGMRLVAAC